MPWEGRTASTGRDLARLGGPSAAASLFLRATAAVPAGLIKFCCGQLRLYTVVGRLGPVGQFSLENRKLVHRLRVQALDALDVQAAKPLCEGGARWYVIGPSSRRQAPQDF